jgi:hypothetical protein
MPAVKFPRALISTKLTRALNGARPFLDGHYLYTCDVFIKEWGKMCI